MVRKKWTEEQKERRRMIYLGAGNPFFGKKHTIKTKEIISKKNLNKGIIDNATRSSIHIWVKRRKDKPALCERCNKNPPYDLANMSQQYKRDIDDFKWLCRSCHSMYDKKVLNIKWMQDRSMIDKDKVIELRKLGYTYKRISEIIKISPQTAWNTVHGLWLDK